MDAARLQKEIADELKHLCERTRATLKTLEPEHDRYRRLLGRLEQLQNHPGTRRMGDLIGSDHSHFNGRFPEWLQAIIRGLGGHAM
jgi:hypothetical protein